MLLHNDDVNILLISIKMRLINIIRNQIIKLYSLNFNFELIL